MLNVALIGFGYWGPNIARNLDRCDRTKLYAICDVSEKNLSRARALYGDGVKYLRSADDVLGDPAVDACAVALRHDVGFPIAQAVLKSGRHLFMEKPLAVTEADALALGRLSEENHVTLHTDHIMMYHPINRYIKGLIDSGEIGDIFYIESNRSNLGPHIKNDINAMWDLAVHDLAVIDWFTGGKAPLRVNAVGLKHYSEKEELTHLTIEYDHFAAFVKSSWVSPLKERTFIIAGTKKMVVFNDLNLDEKLMIYDRGFQLPDDFTEYGRYEVKVRMGDLFIPYIPQEDSLLNSINHFVDCVETGRQSESGYRQAARVISILEQADAQFAGRSPQ